MYVPFPRSGALCRAALLLESGVVLFGRSRRERARSLAACSSAPLSDPLPSSRAPGSGTRMRTNHSAGLERSSGTFPSAKRARPLIVFADDSAIVSLKMFELLTDAGYDVLPTSNGAAAVRLTRDRKPDLVLLDVEMPEMTGTEACAILKADRQTSSIPVVLLTGLDDATHLRDGFRSGCDGYMQKGTTDDEILRKLSLKLLPGTSLQGK